MAYRVGIIGAQGKMGKQLVSLLLSNSFPNLTLQAAFVNPQSSEIGKKVSEKICYEPWSQSALKELDVLIEFTHADATMKFLSAINELKKPIVIGTTGFSEAQKMEIQKISKRAPIILTPNTSMGIHVLFELIKKAAELLPQSFEPSIIEYHHSDKKDAPSGTAHKLREQMKTIIPQSPIPIQSIRGGDVIGEHTVLFLGSGERLELSHRATSRDIFAKGALNAAQWLVQQKPGLYTFQDVLEGKNS